MAYQNGTTHYNLPQTVGTDKRDWSDTNKAFADVDAALYDAAESSTNNKTTIDKLVLDVNQNTQDIDTNKANIATNTADIGTNKGNISKLQSDLQTAQTDLHAEIVDVRNDSEDMITAYNEPNATSAHAYAVGDYFIYNDILYKATAAIDVGNTIVPNTNCTATNVTTEIKNIPFTYTLSKEATSLSDLIELYPIIKKLVDQGRFNVILMLAAYKSSKTPESYNWTYMKLNNANTGAVTGQFAFQEIGSLVTNTSEIYLQYNEIVIDVNRVAATRTSVIQSGSTVSMEHTEVTDVSKYVRLYAT